MTTTADTTSEKKRFRLQLDLNEDHFARVERMREQSGAKTEEDVARNALRLYEWFLEQKRQGYAFQLVKEDQVKEVEIML